MRPEDPLLQPSLAERFINSLKLDGLSATVGKCVLAPFRQVRTWQEQYRHWRLRRSSDPRVIFALIHRLNFWNDPESVSGPGSTLEYTANLRQHLPVVFQQNGVRTLFDAPCGDFIWMRQVMATNSIFYIGGDIVPALVKTNQATCGDSRTSFILHDITRDPFPAADLWFCRDCLFHLTNQQILSALRNFATSSVPLVLLTNDRGLTPFENIDIRTGDCRPLNLGAPPFNLPTTVLYRIPEGPEPNTGREMCLWSREQISAALPAMEQAMAFVPLPR